MADGDLSEKQELALELVISGRTDGEIADGVGVSRQWVNRWRNHDEIFMDALYTRRIMMREQHMDRMNHLISKSLSVLEEELEYGTTQQRVGIAKFLLRLLGLRGYANQQADKQSEENLIDILAEAIGEANEEIHARYMIEGIGKANTQE